MLGGGEQTKPILQMYHCRPMYYILHCDVRYTTSEEGVNSAWLGGVEFLGGYSPCGVWLGKPLTYT